MLGEDYARTKVTLEISERAAEELAEYTRWVEKWSGIAANEAKFKTVDFALREIFRRDRIWQAERRGPSEPAKAAAGGGAARRRHRVRRPRLLPPYRHPLRASRARTGTGIASKRR